MGNSLNRNWGEKGRLPPQGGNGHDLLACLPQVLCQEKIQEREAGKEPLHLEIFHLH